MANIKRLEHAIGVLKEVQSKKLPYNQNVWSRKRSIISRLKSNWSSKYECCGFGWIAHDPWAQSQGVTLEKANTYFHIFYGSNMDFHAVARYFDISYFVAIDLFGFHEKGIGYIIAVLEQELADARMKVDAATAKDKLFKLEILEYCAEAKELELV